MWAYYNGFVSPTYLDLTASSELFLMVTLGGPSTLIGPVLAKIAKITKRFWSVGSSFPTEALRVLRYHRVLRVSGPMHR
jgi:ABC-type branched-subunit amino acid transport system permease subunit